MPLEDRFREVLTDAIAEIRTRLESEFTSTLTDVRREADRDKSAAIAVLDEAKAAELAAAEDDKVTALAAAEEARTVALAEAKGSVEAALLLAFQSEKEALASSHQSRLSQVREAVDTEMTRMRDEAAAEAARLRAEADDTAARLRDEADAALAAARAEAQQATADAARQREELDAALTQAKRDADAALARLREEHETAFVAARTEAQTAAAAHSLALETQLTAATRVLESVRALDGASSLTEVLDALTMAAAKEAGRSAMLVVKGDRLIGWRLTGFGVLDDEPRAIESSTSDVGVLAAAVNTGRPAIVGSGSVLAAPSFSDLPSDRSGLAVPLLVAGRPVAVLYADPGSAAPPSTVWTSPVEVLVRHAGRCLEAMAVQRGVHAKTSGTRVGMPA